MSSSSLRRALPSRLIVGSVVALLGLVTASLVGCSVVVASGELQEGCPSGEKVCETGEDVLECVADNRVEWGCSSDDCRPCSIANAVARCSNSGTCDIATCEGSFDDCDEKLENGCEIDLSRDEKNCGQCGRECSIANGSAVCSRGTCMISTCLPGFDNCDESNANGCETDLLTSKKHCGECGAACAGTCVEGECT